MISAMDAFNHADVKIVLLGPAAVGKTSITMRYIKDQFQEHYDPSAQNSFYKKYNIDQEPGCLEILDTGGQEDFKAITDNWIHQGEGFLVVYSVDSDYSFQMIEGIIKRIRQIREDQPRIPIVVVGNKCDLESSREVEQQQLIELAAKYSVQQVETSAKTGKNIEECVTICLKMILKQKHRNKPAKQQIIDQPIIEEPSCCEKCVII